MKDHVCLVPVSREKRHRLVEIRNETRNIFAIWTLILGGCTMTFVAIAVMLMPRLPF